MWHWNWQWNWLSEVEKKKYFVKDDKVKKFSGQIIR